jgi:LysR family glycine cleavage system transcriptional activator
MTFELPPLHALRALEVAGRYVSFTRAADELNVTPGAISRHIRGLEEALGFNLFERGYREVRLTPEGQLYVDAVSGAFRQMERATREIVGARRQDHLHIHAAITFTLRWLTPRLVGFHARHPQRRVKLSTDIPDISELAVSATDVWIALKDAQEVAALGPSVVAYPLVEVDLLPVCSPKFLTGMGLDRQPGRLAEATRLISAVRQHDWRAWLVAAGIDADPAAGIRFESSLLTYQAAIEGLGVAIAMRALVGEDLRTGRLVQAHPLVHRTGGAFYLIHSAAHKAQLCAFRNWILREGVTADPAAG